MDGLALLCNLCADGPVTLRRLRLAGVASLTDLERAAPAQLAEWLHASVPQALGFVAEAEKLRRRLAEEQLPALSLDSLVSRASRTPRAVAEPGTAAFVSTPAAPRAEALRPGLLPGLDEALCARLALHHVRTLQALGELAGLALARRTGIPYSTLLELSRQARRLAATRARESQAGVIPRAELEPVAGFDTRSESAAPVAEPAPAAVPERPQVVQLRHLEARPASLAEVELREVELRPFEPRPEPLPKRALSEKELTRSDEFTLPLVEPESAGPFG